MKEKNSVKELYERLIILKKKDPIKFLECLPEFLVDMYSIGLCRKIFDINEKNTIEYWNKKLAKSKNIDYNLKKVILGILIYLIGNKIYNKK